MMKTIYRIAKIEWLKWLGNPRIIIALLMPFIVKVIAIEPLVERSKQEGMKMNVFEPVIAVGNSGLLSFLLPAVFLILMSDFPKIEPNSFFLLSRSGKKNWLYGQVLFAGFAIITFMVFVYVSVILFSLGNTEFSDEWSKITRTYVSKYPGKEASHVVQLLPPNLYNQMGVIKALVLTAILQFLMFFQMCMIFMAFTIGGKKKAGLVTIFMIMIGGMLTCTVDAKAMWAFPLSNSLIWLHYTPVFRKEIFPIWFSYFYFCASIIIMIIYNSVLIKKIDFNWEER